MRSIERVAEFLGFLSRTMLAIKRDTVDLVSGNDAMMAELAVLRQGRDDMATTLQTILLALTAQGQQIDQLVAKASEAEQADFDKVNAAIAENTAKITAALAPADTTVQSGAGQNGGTATLQSGTDAAGTAGTTSTLDTGTTGVVDQTAGTGAAPIVTTG